MEFNHDDSVGSSMDAFFEQFDLQQDVELDSEDEDVHQACTSFDRTSMNGEDSGPGTNMVPRHPSSYSTLPASCQAASIDEIISKVSMMRVHGIPIERWAEDPTWRSRMESLTTRDLVDLYRQSVRKAGIWLAQV